MKTLLAVLLMSALPALAQEARPPKGFVAANATVNGARIHYAVGGQGPVVVLLHGYAQTSHMWTPLMPVLAKTHTVIVPDLRGAGDSERTAGGYDKKNMAKDMHELVRKLGHEKVQLVGHDIGLMVAYAYAAQYPAETQKVVLMDAFLPGVGDWQKVWLLRDLWHFHFYGETPLALVKGRERIYFEHFWNDFAADRTKSVSEADRRLYARAYARDGGMRAGFEYFRNFEQDAKDFAAFAQTKLDMPFLVLTGEKASGTFLIEQTKQVANHVTGVVVPGSGHWLMDEAPGEVMPAIERFLDSPASEPFLVENEAAMHRMMAAMSIEPSGDVDRDFVAMMVPHHQGAIDMAKAQLRYGRNEQLRRIAQEIIVTQQAEIGAMTHALRQPP